ncbi:MAG: D-alanine--D-alanine ligase [Deltaproteobacteria bacterium]|nr:D-alanine--D-alanine ligase [Deltaproteobacteria bacterium]
MRIAFTHNLQTSHDEAQAEFDREETVAEIASALRSLGHEVARVDVGAGSAATLVQALEAVAPDLVFNTAEGTHGRFREAFYPGLFEQLGLPFTGSDAYVCALTLDKQITKMLLARHGIPTPRWLFVDADTDVASLDVDSLRFPVIVKPNFEGSSKGITLDSIVESKVALRARVEALVGKYPTGLLIEEFIVGRDIVVPFLEAASPSTGGVLEPASYRFDERVIGKRKYAIYDYELKCVASDAVEVECPAPLAAGVRARMLELSKKVFAVLGVRDLGRIDWRLADDGTIFFLEVNALPSLEPGAGIYLSGALAGLTNTADVLDAVVKSAAHRQGVVVAPSPFSRAKKIKVGLTYNLKRVVPKHAGDDDSEAEYDSATTIDALARAIAADGHQVVRLEATRDIVRRLPDAGVDVVFNLAEGVGGRAREAAVPAMLELLGVPHSGSEAATMAMALDKAAAKAVVAQAGVPTPKALVVSRPDQPLGALRFPVIVKPNAEGSSKGVSPKSVVEDEPALRREIAAQLSRYRQPVLVEEFLPGREFTVGVLGDAHEPRVLPPMEIVFVEPDSKHPVYAFGDKLDWTKKIRYDAPAKVTDALGAEIERVALGAWRALHCRDVARFDLRCDADGRVCFIEVNTLPGLTPGWSDLCMIAEAAGLGYQALISAILAPALVRRAAKRGAGPAHGDKEDAA